MTTTHYAGLIPARADIYDYLLSAHNEGRTASLTEIIRDLSVDEEGREPLRRRVLAMAKDQQLLLNDEQFSPNIAAGRVGMVTAGTRDFGWLRLAGEDDWFIPPSMMKNCIPGEQVLAFPDLSSDRGPSAYILKKIRLLNNVRVEISYEKGIAFASVNGYHKVPVQLCGVSTPVADGSWVFGHFTAQPTANGPYTLKVIEQLSAPNPVDQLRFRSLQDRGFTANHDEATNQEATELCALAPTSETDLTHLTLVSVDGATSQDLDDLIGVARWGDDGFVVHVAIADVARVVPTGSLTDQAAMERATSVYLPGASYPMLPDLISHMACSLLPGALRNAIVVEMYVDHQGQLRHYRFIEGRVRSSARLTYSRVEELMTGAEPRTTEAKLVPMLKLAYELEAVASTFGQGMEFRSAEHYALFDDQSDIIGFKESRSLRAHRMIEKFMVLANIAAATYLSETQNPFYRHHPGLKPESIPYLNNILQSYGLEPLHSNSTAADCEIIKEQLDASGRVAFESALRKAITNARYHTVESSHFGLGLTYYTHFTSPIRRAADLIVHRCIKLRMLQEGQRCVGAHDYSADELAMLAAHFSERSHQASLAERDAMNRLALRYLSLHRDSIPAQWEGVISGISPKMVFVRVPGTPFDAGLPRSALTQEPVMGASVCVRIININESIGQVLLALAPATGSV